MFYNYKEKFMIKFASIILVFSLVLLTTLSIKAKDKKMRTIYSIEVETIDHEKIKLSDYKGKVILIVNVASKCGFTPQYKGLQEIYDKYKENGFVVLGFPSNQFGKQEPGTEEDIKEFCSVNYGVSFPMFSKIDVNGENEHPLYTFLKAERSGIITDAIKWNFTKFLIDKKGIPVKRYAPQASPQSISEDIEKYLSE